MATIFDVPTNDLIEGLAMQLKTMSGIQPPVWAPIVKTGQHKERPPAREDWWYVRCAAVLRAVRIKGPIGVEKLRTKYGGRKNRGHKPDRFRKGSGNILRKVLQQLEKEGLVIKDVKGNHKGRILTPKGNSLLNKIAVQIDKAARKENKE